MDYNWIKIAEPLAEGKHLVPPLKLGRIKIKGKVLFITHCKGKYFAANDACPHAGASLSQGWVNEKGEVLCPFHRYTFDVETGKNTSGEGLHLQTYPVEVREDGVFIGFEKPKKTGWFW